MTKYIRLIRQNINNIYRVLLFIITLGIVVYIFPNIRYFRYEFQKGKPWMHETLIAPFDFAIYKTDKEFLQEQDSILKNYKPYFRYDSEILSKQKEVFLLKYNEKWKIFARSSSFKKLNLSENRIIKIKELHFEKVLRLLTKVYKIGIIEFSDELEFKKNQPVVSIISLRNNVAEEYRLDDIFTPKSAYEYIITELKKAASNLWLKEFEQDLNINAFLYPNLSYNAKMSANVKKSMIANISLTRGMVQARERIVSEGEIINDDTYRELESIKKEYENILGSSQSHYLIVLGQFLLIFFCLLALYLFLNGYRRAIFHDNKKLFFILLMLVLFVAMASFSLKFRFINLYIVPFALITIIIRTFMDTRTAFFMYLVTILLVGFLAPNSFEFVFLQLAAGIIALFSLTKLERRGQLIFSAILVFLTYSVVYFAFAVTQEGNIRDIEWRNFLWFAGNGLLLTFSYPLIYIFEKLFGFLSDVTLIELSNPNHPLLRKLTQTSPGTFQHSLQVANLAEEAIYKIGGNPLLVRTGALYHDIGKMKHPIYFIENQGSNENPHDKLDFDKSAQLITEHVKYGLEIAKKHKIPQQIIDFIQTHHGNDKVQYFYRSFKNKYPDREVDYEKFTYPGPDPFTKETSVLMMADAVEAASRSLKVKTQETISQLIEEILDKQVNEQRFNNADITFRNIKQIKEIFTQKLINIYHARIEYPKETTTPNQ